MPLAITVDWFSSHQKILVADDVWRFSVVGPEFLVDESHLADQVLWDVVAEGDTGDAAVGSGSKADFALLLSVAADGRGGLSVVADGEEYPGEVRLIEDTA